MEELRQKPIRFWRLDDDTPFSDYSGYSGTFTRTGTEIKGVALTSSAAYSQTFNSTHGGSFTVPDWRLAGSETRPSSVSFSIYLDHPAGTFMMFNDDESWTFTGNTITYTLTLSTGDLEIVYDYEYNKRLNIVLNYSIAGIELFVNGVKVATADITDDLRPYTLSSTSAVWTILCSGATATMNNLAFYQRALSGETVEDLHNYNTRHAPEEVPAAYGGQVVDVSSEVRTPSMEVRWDTQSEFSVGLHQNTVVDNDQLQAQRELGLTLDGKWSNSITFAGPVPLSVFNSAYITWSGKNAEVQVSLDGTTWITPVYGKNLSIIPTGFDPNGKTLQVRVNFTAGDDEAYINEIVFKAFTGADAPNHIDERTITYTNPAAAWDKHDPYELHNFWGTRLDTGKLTIGPDPNMSVKTIEFWCKLDTPTVVSLSGNISSPTTTYINGVAGGAFLNDQWIVVHYTYPGGINTDFWISGNVTVGRIAVYPTVLSAGDIARIVQAYTGYPKSTVSDGAVIGITEPGTPAVITDHQWADLKATT